METGINAVTFAAALAGRVWLSWE